MREFDVEAFVARMDGAGLKLTAVRLADGQYRVNRWRMPNALTELIEDLWASQIGENQSRIDQLVAFLTRKTSPSPIGTPHAPREPEKARAAGSGGRR
jgi:hypothetical protein